MSDDLLQTLRERAAGYDRDNAFPVDDLRDLEAAGYLKSLVPLEFGGEGLSLLELTRQQRRLAAAAPATALAINMHLIWTGVAKTLRDRGDDSLEYVLRDAAAGEIFAFAISEPGNDLVLFGSKTQARPHAGGAYSFTGTKIFTSASPVWTQLGVFGLDTESADAPKLVHAFLPRGTGGVTALGDWDTIGMRGSQSQTTILDGAVADASRIFGRRDPGPSQHPLVFAIFANFEVLVSAVYTGIADRGLELAVTAARRRRSAKTGQTADQNPDTRWKIADAALSLDAIIPQLESLAADIDSLVDHEGQWFRKLAGLKLRSTDTARYVVDQALRVTGGSSYFATSELGRLYRDVLAGSFHPSNEDSVHATVAAAVLGPLDG
ncbi:MAG: acyl-CoA dehydrogenase [Homoserinimonas sp.]|nr:acyl-CoA dehydrogenase [Homoserinimonas sp.]